MTPDGSGDQLTFGTQPPALGILFCPGLQLEGGFNLEFT